MFFLSKIQGILLLYYLSVVGVIVRSIVVSLRNHTDSLASVSFNNTIRIRITLTQVLSVLISFVQIQFKSTVNLKFDNNSKSVLEDTNRERDRYIFLTYILYINCISTNLCV